ncbi:hypothetical protein [Photobacterium satsumensis]|uniref:hypothetical protein n=1 Tax=Photobacterium satsumensis TaxID=2910239 RepID=UPI003D1431FA
MNRFILATVLLAFSTVTLADLNSTRSEFGSWVVTSEQSSNAVNSLPHGRKPTFDNTEEASSVKQLTVPQTLKDVRKRQSNIYLASYEI